MTGPKAIQGSGGFGVNDVIYILFKHKGKIIFASLAGIIAATAAYLLPKPLYESQAKLLVRYVIETSVIDSMDDKARPTAGKAADNIINAEVAILTSWDIAAQVAEAVGVEALSRGSGQDLSKGDAAALIVKSLTVTATRGSNVITVAYRHRDSLVATQVLTEIIDRYLKKHMEVHRGTLAVNFVEQRTDQARARLSQTEQELQRLKRQAGIISLDNASANLDASLATLQEAFNAAEAQVVEQQARVNELERQLGTAVTSLPSKESKEGNSTTPALSPDAEDVQRYQLLVARLSQLRNIEWDLLSRYRPEHPEVKRNQIEIEKLANIRRELERTFPNIAVSAPASTGSSPIQADLAAERTRLAAAEARFQVQKERLKTAQEARRQFVELAPQIGQLERAKSLEEAAYTYMAGRLDKAKVDQTLDTSDIDNISPIQSPTPAASVTSSRNKVAAGLVVGGVAFGLGFAFLVEMFVYRTVKRPGDLEALLDAPAFFSIPQLDAKVARALVGRTRSNIASSSDVAATPWAKSHFMYSYAEAVRDRLNIFFEVNAIKHKPKLVGVTGLAEGDGASTLAAGLAAALSETTDGKVLLVDLNTDHADTHSFLKGRPSLLTQDNDLQMAVPSPTDNLFVAAVSGQENEETHTGTRRFHDLMPKLQASHFDYIVFDMPAAGLVSSAIGLSRYMDKVLLVIESEKHNPDVLRRSYNELLAARANVSCILNKVRSYAPRWALHEA